MCNALLELMKDELDEKREEGEALGENRINQLILKLSELNRTDEILQSSCRQGVSEKIIKGVWTLKKFGTHEKTSGSGVAAPFSEVFSFSILGVLSN